MKKTRRFFWQIGKKKYLCSEFLRKSIKFGLWCNGSTTGFGSVCPGSNPGNPTDKKAVRYFERLFCYLYAGSYLYSNHVVTLALLSVRKRIQRAWKAFSN